MSRFQPVLSWCRAAETDLGGPMNDEVPQLRATAARLDSIRSVLSERCGGNGEFGQRHTTPL